MHKSAQIFTALKKGRLIALLNPSGAHECLHAYENLNPLGVVLEIAFRSEQALPGIQAVCDRFPDALILAGTVLTTKQAEAAIEAGAAGVVSADFIPEVVEVCAKKDVMCIPGGWADAGKQLAYKAQILGCSMEALKRDYPHQWIYKLFPAFSGETSHMELARAWRGPYPELTVLYTGGINRGTLKQAVQKDPEGIFCASALLKIRKDAERLQADVSAWRTILQPPPAPGKETPVEKDSPQTDEPRVVTFGEVMARLSPAKGERLQTAQSLSLHFGGAEANVAVSLARFGLEAAFVSALPVNDVGDNACRILAAQGVDTAFLLRQGQRVGIYYLEHGAGPRPSQVIYDRAGSAVSQITASDLDWDKILHNAAWFHWTGITPALGAGVAEALKQGLEVARQLGITVSVDLNYRKKLWSKEKAREVMSELMPYVDICVGNEEDPTHIFGIEPAGTDVNKGEIDTEGYRALTAALVERFGFRKAAITLRESLSASENVWSACLNNGDEFLLSPRYQVGIVDRVGSGDAFAAGLIYSLLKGRSDQTALEFAVAAAVLKHSIYGDFNLVSVPEVERFAAGERSGRIQR
jgi:2-dehydro-3-deoxygluconokinase